MVPDFVRLGFTAATPLPNQGFPARFLGPVGPNVTLLDGKALANGRNAGGETGPGEGRTALSTPTSPAVDGGAAPYGGSRSEVVINTQLQLAI